ncbi:uncharacterized protein ACNLHF_002586 isoform 2-T2 [Anomaloglossus baeobatrachus]
MKTLVALLCMVSALVGSVYSIKCYSCYSKNSPTCDDEKVINCEHKYKDLSTVLRKGCITDYSNINCGRTQLFWYPDRKYETFMSCCDRNLCNTEGFAYGKNKKRI